MRKWILAALAAVALSTAGGDALAQEEVDRPWAIRLGVLWPTDGAVRNLTDDSWFNAGIDYTFRRVGVNEWIGAIDFGSASRLNAWMFQVIYKWHHPTGANPFSYGVGAAVYHFDPSGPGDQTEYGIPLVADWNFTPQLFAEGKYHWVASDVDLSSFSVQLGYRF